jgi:hypothetical protein
MYLKESISNVDSTIAIVPLSSLVPVKTSPQSIPFESPSSLFENFAHAASIVTAPYASPQVGIEDA